MKLSGIHLESVFENYLWLCLLLVLGMNTVCFSGPRLSSYYEGMNEQRMHNMMMREKELQIQNQKLEMERRRREWAAEQQRKKVEAVREQREWEAEQARRDFVRALQQRNLKLERNVKYYARDMQRKGTFMYGLIRICPAVEKKALAMAEKGDVDGAVHEMRYVKNWCQRNKGFLQSLSYTGGNELLQMISEKAKYYLNQEYLAKIYAAK